MLRTSSQVAGRLSCVILLAGLTSLLPASGQVQMEWARTYGPSSNFIPVAMALDQQSNVWVVGTLSNDFLTIKYSPTGTQLWEDRYGDSLLDSAGAIAVDPEGNVWVAGVSSTNRLDGNITIIKYGSEGSRLWARRFHESINDTPYGILGNASERIKLAVDSTGNAYAVANAGPSSEYFIVKSSPDGDEVWSRRYAAPPSHYGSVRGIALDAAGNIVVAGGANAANGVSAFFTVKYDSAGTFQWAAVDDWEGTSNFVTAMAVDPAGNVYLTGASLRGKHRFLTVKYSPDGETLWVAARPPANGRDAVARDLAVDAEGNVIVTGDENWEWNEDFDIYEMLTVKYDAAGNEVWSARSAVNNRRIPLALALDAEGSIYVAACDRCDTTPRMMLLKYTPMGSQLWETFVPSLFLRDLKVDGTGNVYVSGEISSEIDTGNSISKFVQSSFPSQLTAVVEPSRAQVPPGSNVTFTAVVSGPGPYIYRWKRFGFDLPGQNRATLTLTNVQGSGDYTVVVSNRTTLAYTVSPEARLFVSVPVSLSAVRNGNETILSWPTNAVGFALQSTLNPGPTSSWTAVSEPPAVSNARFTITNSLSSPARFYRLIKE